MNENELFEAIGNTDDELIEKSEEKPIKNRSWIKWTGLSAACICALVIGYAAIHKIHLDNYVADVPPETTTTTQHVVIPPSSPLQLLAAPVYPEMSPWPNEEDFFNPDYTFNDFYFRMYFQLLHHNIDLDNNYNIYFDIKDTCSQSKLHKLRDILKWNASIRNFQFIRSHESSFMQLADVLMGAINYNLRIEKGDIEGKVIAKREIVKHINKHTNISLKRTSPLSAKKFNLFFITLK